jgi:hypothetical protein
MRRKITIEQKLHQQSEEAKSEAEKLPCGKEREALMRKARQLKTPRKSIDGYPRQRCSRRNSATCSVGASSLLIRKHPSDLIKRSGCVYRRQWCRRPRHEVRVHSHRRREHHKGNYNDYELTHA